MAKFITAKEAAQLIPDGAVVGLVGRAYCTVLYVSRPRMTNVPAYCSPCVSHGPA